jgi:dihydroflavonol-4-reductase
MRALVTGSNGLIGANLVRELIRGGHHVRAFLRKTSDRRSLQKLPVEVVSGDVLELDSLCDATRGCDVVFHAAAIFSYSGTSAATLERLAIQGTANAIKAAHSEGVRRVVLTSSSVVMGSSNRPLVRNEQDRLDDQETVPYIRAKELQERAAVNHADKLDVELILVCPTVTVGPHSYHLGPSNGIILSYLNDISKATYPGGCNIVSARDIAKGHLLAAQKGKPGERYLLGSENLRWSSIHSMISELCGTPGPSWEANHTISLLAATACEFASKLTRTPLLTTRNQALMVGRYYWYEHKKAAQLGYRPRPARVALAEAIAWLSASAHISRQTRVTLRLSREVFQAKKALEIDEARIRARV